MWQAIITNDRSFDGRFYYGVVTTGIYCRPSCKSKIPKRPNIRFFDGIHHAAQEGFRPCKRCQPNLANSSPEPATELVSRITEILYTRYHEAQLPAILPSLAGISVSYLQHLFKKQTGYTLNILLRNIRIDKAKELLITSEFNNTEICYTVGFQSLSCFYAAFRVVTGISPGEYRLRNLRLHRTVGGSNEIGI